MSRQDAITVFSTAVILLILGIFFCIWQFCTAGWSEAVGMITLIDVALLGASTFYWIKALVRKE